MAIKLANAIIYLYIRIIINKSYAFWHIRYFVIIFAINNLVT